LFHWIQSFDKHKIVDCTKVIKTTQALVFWIQKCNVFVKSKYTICYNLVLVVSSSWGLFLKVQFTSSIIGWVFNTSMWNNGKASCYIWNTLTCFY
jgi:hypothetical protein